MKSTALPNQTVGRACPQRAESDVFHAPRADRRDRLALPVPGCRVLQPLVVFLAAGIVLADDFQGSTHQVAYDGEEIRYSIEAPDDPVARLQKRIDNGEARLKFDSKFGYLPALLEFLHVPQASQMLVFSKTSLQRHLISPSNPRAIYYSDDVYVGYIPGAPLLEVSAMDPNLGGVFYSLAQEETAQPKFKRSVDCLQCHGAAKTMGVPGHFVRSIATDETGELDTHNEASYITHRTPLEDRWAGWYVTGTHGDQIHRGNLIGAAAFEQAAKEPYELGNLADLSRFFETRKYLGTGSDIVALMVLEHQAHMQNYVTRLNFESRIMLRQYGHIRYLKSQSEAFLRYLLLTAEAPLTGPVRGNPEFTKEFQSHGPRDRRGRSLRDLDLQTRLFKHPCSYGIYSPAFDNLPAPMKEHLYQRLWNILTGQDQSRDFEKVRAEDRAAILEILLETKYGLPEYWQSGRTRSSATAGRELAN
ncbi:MAG: hypothetical protein FJ398_01805 [Verrucomicrobia bacterium]|nr:hypothetical protein [Verrucomicrobiota bacterium]